MTRVKICCISSIEEARIAVREGASALGLVSQMPSGPGVVTEDLIAEIAATVPPSVGTFLLTSRTEPADIIAQQKRCRVNTIQICDRLAPGAHDFLRESLPGVSLVQVVHVNDESSVEEALEVSRVVDAILLDSGNQSLPVKELGGTGRTHDWALSKRIVQSVDVPVFLAGGLHAGNVSEAIRAVEPFGVDLCTGVRTEESLDPRKLSAFMEAVRSVA
ncbi:phosphoribosylanthranilate isomerase [Aidingimonas halophila]|uniref:N-(5'-phosphoribosyl)anthranilate isomerase n=1 Tax=Aidingimonas halophila TaxID=574349 RepID=A0A1H2ZZ24_9GAMM|nr:phosphoribosylanthranilate isomerase [Aidingimonas halophila]GHC16943.1 N-(5'-phosphoribosyl)anthranilate isomerase [Aidingimonas halophila]SDX22184.1 phosphoribosylanthranilate isomerase [Aidingimonas halophila]